MESTIHKMAITHITIGLLIVHNIKPFDVLASYATYSILVSLIILRTVNGNHTLFEIK